MENESKKKNKKNLKRVAFAAGATLMLGGGIIASGAVKSYEASNQIPEANYMSMQNVDSINVGSTKASTIKLANTDVSTQADTIYVSFNRSFLTSYNKVVNAFNNDQYVKIVSKTTSKTITNDLDKVKETINSVKKLGAMDFSYETGDAFQPSNIDSAIQKELGLNENNGFLIIPVLECTGEAIDEFSYLDFCIGDIGQNYLSAFLYDEYTSDVIVTFKVYSDRLELTNVYDYSSNLAYEATELYENFDWYSDANYSHIKTIVNSAVTSGMFGFNIQSTPIDADYPTISSGDIVVNVDNPLTLDQIKSCFSANDPTEGDITDRITFSDITYKLDSNGKIAVGKYSITANVSDTSGNSASLTKKIHVVDITSPIVAGTNFSTGNITKLTDAEILKHLTYSDNYYGKDDITISLEYSDYIANYNKPGEYDVSVTATDKSGNVGTTVLTITVTDTTKPTITGTDKTTGNVTCLTQDELKALFTATDDVTASPKISIVNDGYTANYRKPGTYTVTARATDEAGNTSDTSVTITVTDTTAPTIAAISATKNQSYTTKLTEEELKALFKATDDVTTSPTVTIVSDNYSAKYSTPGTYTVTAKATDEAGNTAQASVTIKVIDDIKPIIVLTKEVKTTTQLPLTLADIAKFVSATDAIDGSITPSLTDKDGYLTKTNKVGTYTFEVTATDKSGNVAKETFVIIVEDKDVPVITVSGYTITAAAGQVYKRSDIIKFLIQTGQLTEEEADTVSVESNYFDSENPEAGNYELTITRADGSVQQMSLLVTESNNDAEKNEGFWGWIKNHLAIVLTALGAVVLAALGFVFLRKKRR